MSRRRPRATPAARESQAGASREAREPRAPGAPRPISRRKFVGLVAAGSAAVIAARASAAPRPKPKAAAPPAPAAPTPEQKEFDRQRANLQSTLKTIRDFELPPGGDLPVVFRPLTAPRRGR